ncbi:MAG TPA: response regulator [Terracidiphilus sp.]|jgi:CheY-like chemotaxis protein
MAETLILSVDLDPMILNTREAVLRSEGYIVVSAASIKEAFHQFHEGDFDLMILGETIPARDRERLTCLIRASGSRIPIASISSTLSSTPWERSFFPDASLLENSSEIVAGIRRLLARRFELAALGGGPVPTDQLAVAAPIGSRV